MINNKVEHQSHLDIQYFAHKGGFHNEQNIYLKPFLEWMGQFITNSKLTFKLNVEAETLDAYDGIVNIATQNCVFRMREYDYSNDIRGLTTLKSTESESKLIQSDAFLELYNALNQLKSKVHSDCELVFMKKCDNLSSKNILITIHNERCIAIVV